jgi:NarL family two-component system response regulator LiaR
MKTIRVLIVDDHPMMREALRNALSAEADLEVAGEAVNGAQAVQRTLFLQPDVVVMDLYLPVKDGLQATAEILDAWPEARILVITSSTEDEKVLAAVQAGALGYLLKDASRRQFVDGVKAVARGELYLPPGVAEKLARGVRGARAAAGARPQPGGQPPPALTGREAEVLGLLGEGLANAEIAARLGLSESTVRVHVHNLLEKLNLETRSQAIVYANRQAKS